MIGQRQGDVGKSSFGNWRHPTGKELAAEKKGNDAWNCEDQKQC
jgi:hypothetical protein